MEGVTLRHVSPLFESERVPTQIPTSDEVKEVLVIPPTAGLKAAEELDAAAERLAAEVARARKVVVLALEATGRSTCRLANLAGRGGCSLARLWARWLQDAGVGSARLARTLRDEVQRFGDGYKAELRCLDEPTLFPSTADGIMVLLACRCALALNAVLDSLLTELLYGSGAVARAGRVVVLAPGFVSIWHCRAFLPGRNPAVGFDADSLLRQTRSLPLAFWVSAAPALLLAIHMLKEIGVAAARSGVRMRLWMLTLIVTAQVLVAHQSQVRREGTLVRVLDRFPPDLARTLTTSFCHLQFTCRQLCVSVCNSGGSLGQALEVMIAALSTAGAAAAAAWAAARAVASERTMRSVLLRPTTMEVLPQLSVLGAGNDGAVVEAADPAISIPAKLQEYSQRGDDVEGQVEPAVSVGANSGRPQFHRPQFNGPSRDEEAQVAESVFAAMRPNSPTTGATSIAAHEGSLVAQELSMDRFTR